MPQRKKLPAPGKMNSNAVRAPVMLQRKCACGKHTTDQHGECTECGKKRMMLRRSAMYDSVPQTAPPIVHDVLRAPGKPLDPETRAYMEPRFGQDFSHVRVHDDARAARSARAVNALAYTVGHNVVFGAGRYTPQARESSDLLMHELVHVVHQRNAASQPSARLAIAPPTSAAERQADKATEAALGARSVPLPPLQTTTMSLNRQFDPSPQTASEEQETVRHRGSTLPFRQATELAECIRIMGQESMAYCRQTVLGEAPPAPVAAPLALAVNPAEVQPRATGGVERATVTVTNAPAGARLAPTVTAVANSGGHQHHNGRPVGTIVPASRVASGAGQATFTYRSNVPGGRETIVVRAGGATAQKAIDVRVPDLAELQPGADFDLVGQTATHPDNHFAAAATITGLQQIAAGFEAHKVAQNLPNWPRVAYNDISLEHGGLFDINAGWAPPHETHRVGLNVDFRTNHLNAAQRGVLRPLITGSGAAILDEGNHWHLTY